VQQYELDFSGGDSILAENKFMGFHEAAENVDKAMVKWKEDYDRITKDEKQDISSTLTNAMD
jgi:hypothetical protein